MTYTVEALGDFMRVGPQVYPERPNAVQVIMRGPHGKRLAADPVRTREGRARGSGFRTWIEQLNVPANESWNPPQKVVGLLGVTDWLADLIADTGMVDARGGNTSGRKFDPKANQTAGVLTPVDKAARTQAVMAFDQESRRDPARYDAEQFRVMGGRVRDMLVSSRWTDSGVAPNGSYMSQPDLLRVLSEAQSRLIQRGGVREDGAPMISPTAVGPDGRERWDDPREAARRTLREELPKVAPAAGSMLLKVAAVAGVGLAIYALASGYGKGLATRRFTPPAPPKET